MKKGLKKVLCLLACVMLIGCTSLCCFAVDDAGIAAQAEENANEAVSAVSSALSQVTGTLSIGNIVSILAIVLGIAVGFFFFWWGVRKVMRIAQNAFSKGKLSPN